MESPAAPEMRWASALSREASFERAVGECVRSVRERLGAGEVSVAFAFITPHFAARFEDLYGLVSEALGPEVFLGCSGGGVIGAFTEVEYAPAVSLVAARLPGVSVRPFRIPASPGALPDLDGPPGAWERLVGVPAAENPALVLLSDPFSARTEALISGLDYAYPQSVKVGGLVSGGTSPNTNALFLDGEVLTSGTVGVALSGDIEVDTVVAQGCRPIGELMTVTSCDGNFLYELDETPALDVVRELFASLKDRDLELARSSLFVGVVMDEFDLEPGPGDFLIRNVIGFDPARGSLAVGERLQPGMRLRFHVRDGETSAEDLALLLDGYARLTGDSGPSANPSGTLLFSCLGRGENLYGAPDFDSSLLRERVGEVPMGGFFCNGEIGPVGGSTFLHGYTSSFAFFRPRTPR